MATQTDYLRIKLESDGSGKVKASLADVGGGLDKVDRSAGKASGSLVGLKEIVGAISFTAIVRGLISANVEFQRLNASLVTVTGSQQAANREFDKLEDFATTTPYQLEEVVGAFIKLKALGLDPSIESLQSYGNTAAAMGKSLDQFIEAVADASTGEFERLKEFGIRARTEGDNIAFTFQGVTTEVRNSSQAIEGYLRDIGEQQFAGAMDQQMDTLAGAFSNLEDKMGALARSFGEAGGINESVIYLTGLFGDLVDFLSEIPEEMARANRALDRMLGQDLGAIKEVEEDIKELEAMLDNSIWGRTRFFSDEGIMHVFSKGEIEARLQEARDLRKLLYSQEGLEPPPEDIGGPKKPEEEEESSDAAAKAAAETQRLREEMEKRYLMLAEMALSEKERENMRHEQNMMDLETYYVEGIIPTEQDYMLLREELERQHQDRLRQIKDEGGKKAVKDTEKHKKMEFASLFKWGNKAVQATFSNNQKILDITKAASLAGTIAAGAKSAAESLANNGGVPYGIPAMLKSLATTGGLQAGIEAISMFGGGGGGSGISGGGAVASTPNISDTPIDASKNVATQPQSTGTIYIEKGVRDHEAMAELVEAIDKLAPYGIKYNAVVVG